MNIEKYKMLYDLHTDVIAAIPSLGSAVQILAGLLAMLYIGNKVWISYAKNEPLDLWVLIKPFVIAFFCVQFNLVTGVIEGTMKPLTSFANGLKEKVKLKKEVALETVIAKAKKAKDNASKLLYETTTNMGNSMAVSNGAPMVLTPAYQRKAVAEKIYKDASDAEKEKIATENAAKGNSIIANASVEDESDFGYIARKMLQGLLWILEYICQLIMEVSLVLLLASRSVSLILLYVLGPLALVLSLIPGWNTAFLAWVGKYASIWLWLPIAKVVLALMLWVEYEYALNANLSIASYGDGLAFAFVAMVLNITTALCISQVPTMAGWFIPNAATTDTMGSGTVAMGAMVGGFLGKGSTLVLGAGWKGAQSLGQTSVQAAKRTWGRRK